MRVFNRSLKTLLLSCSGRVSRRVYLFFVVVSYLVLILLGIVSEFFYVLMTGDAFSFKRLNTISLLYWSTDLIAAVGFVAWIVTGFCMTIKRLHDGGYSAWYYFFIFIPILGLLWVLTICFGKGDLGPNKFGLPMSGEGINFDQS